MCQTSTHCIIQVRRIRVRKLAQAYWKMEDDLILIINCFSEEEEDRQEVIVKINEDEEIIIEVMETINSGLFY
jgi:hypothetical protein